MKQLNIVPIKSLSSFIQEIEKIPLPAYFRGENALFEEHHAGAFRAPLTGQGEAVYDYQEMIRYFYQEISYKLSSPEKTSFLAFAQHHGIPTNLIDVTTSPLIALYFACQHNDRNDIKRNLTEDQINSISEQYTQTDFKILMNNYFEDWGYIYFFDSVLDVTELIDNLNGKNFIDHYFLNTEKELIELLPYIQKYKLKYPCQFKNLWSELKHIISCTTEEFFEYENHTGLMLLKLFDEQKKTINHKQVYGSLQDNFFELSTLRDQFDLDVINYMMTIATYIDLEKNVFGDDLEFISYMPNFLYSPTIEFERGRNQQGKFLYQVHFSYKNGLMSTITPFNSIALQNIDYSTTIFQIIEKQTILESLDKIGINQKTIWCDFDHVAAYVKEKYSNPNAFKFC